MGFWLANTDMNTNAKLDLHRWQMLTATYDGKTVTLYKDGNQLASGERELPADTAVGRHDIDKQPHAMRTHRVAETEETL